MTEDKKTYSTEQEHEDINVLMLRRREELEQLGNLG